MTNDIVSELRSRAAYEQLTGTIFDRAADEIERLHKRLLAEENAYDIERIINERLMRERDSARRDCCRLVAEIDSMNKILVSPEEVAKGFKWDCFKK